MASQESISGGPELISAQGSDQDDVVLWCGLTGDTEGRFLFSYRGFLEWGSGEENDQDVALFRNQLPGLSVQNFTSTPKTSTKAFSVNAPFNVAAPYSGSSGEHPVFSVDTENIAVRVGAGQSGFADSDFFTTVGRIKTTDSSLTTLATIPLDTARAYYFLVRITARKSDGTAWAFLYKSALVRRESGGSNVEGTGDLGSIQPGGSSTWTCSFSIDGSSNLLVQVRTPSQEITVYWAATIEYQSVSTDA